MIGFTLGTARSSRCKLAARCLRDCRAPRGPWKTWVPYLVE
ncbi:hypothetical protein [Roseomonas mucosa]